MSEESYTRRTPINELDLQLMTIESEWGKDIAPELRQRLVEIGDKLEKDKNGKLILSKTQMWGLLSYYTRDMRLGNLDKESYVVCIEWLDFAGDMIRIGAIKSFLTSLSRVITMLELSQSKGGFLRNALNTFQQRHFHEFTENDKKKGLFAKKKKEENGGF